MASETDKTSSKRLKSQQETRGRLLEAASKLFARDGFASVRLADIAEEASVTTGAVYSNFRGKSELLDAVVRAGFEERGLPTLMEALARKGAERHLAERFERRVKADRDWLLLVQEHELLANREPDKRATLAAHWDGMRARVAAQLRSSGLASPDDTLPAESLATLVVALHAGLTRQRMLDEASASGELLLESLRRLLRPA